MSAPTVIASATLTFDSTTYKLKSLPAGKPQTAEAVDVTCCDDSRKQFAPGAIVVNEDISTTIAGDDPPTENTKAALSLTLDSTTVSIGDAVVKSVTPSTIEAGGGRELTWDVVFTPCGSAPSA